MIPCEEKLMLNRYKAVQVPSNADLFSRFGERVNSVPIDGTNPRFNESKLSGYEEAQKLVDKFIIEERDAYEAQQAEIDRLRLESEELKTLKDSNV